MIVSLDQAKNFLRIDSDMTDDDVLVSTLINAAEAFLTKATGNTFDSTNSLANTVCLMLVAEWYSNRENAQQLNNPQGSVLNGLISQLAMAYDLSPTQTPSGLTGVAESIDIWLRWLPNIEPNVAGYNVYRNGVKLNTELVRRRRISNVNLDFWVWDEFVQVPEHTPPGVVGFKDSQVTPGTQYSYQLTAVDNLGNESAKSPTVKVTAL